MKRSAFCRQLCLLMVLGFLLGVHNGRIALWTDGDTEPRKVFPYPVAALPPQAQAELTQGIRVDSMEDLDRLLENLLS